MAPLKMQDHLPGVGNVAPGGLVGLFGTGLQNATCQTRQGLFGGVGIDGGVRSRVASVEGLKQVKGLATAHLAQHDLVGPVAQRGAKKVPDGHCH